MARKKSFDYKRAAAALRKIGFAPVFGTRRKGANSPAAKAAVKRAYKKVSLYLPGGSKQDFKFVRADTKAKRRAMDGVNPKVRTPAGFFVRVPKGAKKYKIKFKGDTLQIDATGKRGGRRKENVYRLNPANLAKNPAAEISRVTGQRPGKFKGAYLVVNGFQANQLHESLREFEKYMAAFFAVARDPNKPSYLKSHFHGKKLSARQFTDIFHVKIITQDPSHNGTKKNKPAKRRK